MANLGRREVSRPTLSFYITSFLEKLKATELYVLFQEYGTVDEVIIPSRRNKYGHRFGFVRFFEVADEALLATKLDNIFVGKQQLFVNIPRFQRSKRENMAVVEHKRIHKEV